MRSGWRQARDVLVVAPHPDDEAIGAFGLMTALRRHGARVRILVVTDGSASHPGSVLWPPARLVPERRRETARAMRRLGITRARIRYLHLRDGRLADGPDLRRQLRKAIRSRPDLLVLPVPDDAHADHRAVADALPHRCASQRIGYRVWPLGRPRGAHAELRLDGQTRAAKRRTLLSYRTQAGRITDSPTGMAMRAHHLRHFAGPVERFRVLP